MLQLTARCAKFINSLGDGGRGRFTNVGAARVGYVGYIDCCGSEYHRGWRPT